MSGQMRINVMQTTIAEYRYLLNEGHINVHTWRNGDNGNTLLHEAMPWSQITKTRILLARRVAVNVRNNAGQTPLHLLVEQLRPDCGMREWEHKMTCVDLLLAHGADVNMADNRGWRPLHYLKEHAAAFIRFGTYGESSPEIDELERILIGAGADTDACTTDGESIYDIMRRVLDQPLL